MRKENLLLFLILSLSLALNAYGLKWGLPSRWCVDEPVAGALGMIAEKSILPKGDFFHPTFHYFLLIALFLPTLFLLKSFGYHLDIVSNAASISWIRLSIVDPDFSVMIYAIARFSSVLFAVLTVYLSYRLARECYSERAGIYSALFLSVTMGFISEAHTAKSTSCLIFMVILTVFSCVYYYERNTVKKQIIPFLLGGLSLATKYSGGVVIFPLGYYLFKIALEEPRLKKVKICCFALTAFVMGFLLGFPGILLNFHDYISAVGYYRARYVPGSSAPISLMFISGFLGYLWTLKDIFGVGLFLLVLSGIAFSLAKVRANIAVKTVLLIIIPYYIFFSLSPKTFEVKYISLIVPFLIILSSGIFDRLPRGRGFYKKAAFFALAAVWMFSFFYSMACDYIYSRGDIRYAASEWIEQNIPKGQRIVILGLSEWVVHNRLFKEYDITLLNNEIGKFNPKYNRRFSGGEQYDLSRQEAIALARELSAPHSCFVIWPVFSVPERIHFWSRQPIAYGRGIDISRQRVVKEFARKTNYFFWNPNLGGYEPQKVAIAHGVK